MQTTTARELDAYAEEAARHLTGDALKTAIAAYAHDLKRRDGVAQ